ncbi:hypothetical protein [Streptomyces sp. A1499]|uniref:hypothetical protein n=1 Tax=Streptomyces sp. A1499 TaxID=2563104 RepID=UPI0019D19A18|nr:hypothetical protein [Streptomyces sp. A1499]
MLRPTGHTVELADPPDPALLVSQPIAGVVPPVSARVRLAHPMDEALRLAPPAIGTHHPDGPDATIVEIGGNDAEQLATYLFGLGARPKDIRDSQR